MTKEDIKLVFKALDKAKRETMTNSEYSVYSQFDLQSHMKTFINYLEVIIRDNGTVEYAVPSHQEKLISIMMEQTGMSRDEVTTRAALVDDASDFTAWLCRETKCISVWTYGYIGTPNAKQKSVLKKFIDNKLLYASI